MKAHRLVVVGLALSFSRLLWAAPPEFEQLKAEGEKLFDQGSFELAHRVYEQATGLTLQPPERQWVTFRLADTQWRSQAASENADPTKLDQARQQLEGLQRDLEPEDPHERLWAEVEESLGDFHWTRRHNNNWGGAWPYYQRALDWWAGAPDLELARQRYLAMIWRLAQPPGMEPYYFYGYWGNYVPLEILENTLKIAQTPQDRAHAHYLVAMTLRSQATDWDQRTRAPEEFEAALAPGKTTDWYDDALYYYGEWMMNQGRAVLQPDGTWGQTPDYVKALELFRRLVNTFAKGETRYWEQAQQNIRSITDPQVGVSLSQVFLPGSEVQYYLSWRNVKHLDLALYPVDLNRDVQWQEQPDWLHAIDLSHLEKIQSWSRETKDAGDYRPGSDTVRLDSKLKPGAYVLEVSGGGVSARDLVLVSDAALVLKSSGKQALAWCCDALTSKPLGQAQVVLWERWYDGSRWQVHRSESTADQDGVARFQLQRHPNNNVVLFASARRQDRQSFSSANHYWSGRENEPWKIYAFTDRPAYRPSETVQWKFLARRYDGSVYSTPAEHTLAYEITDPHGAKVKEDKLTLNAFGSGWGSLELNAQWPLGEYRVRFWEAGQPWDETHKREIGTATLFRLEEYKLPEFKVSVQTPEESGPAGTVKKTFRLGEKVEVNIQADYYFGGPVANAKVEVLVYQNPFYHCWHRPREYPWLYTDLDQDPWVWQRRYGGQGQIIKRETLKTDALGKARLTFETPRNEGQDLEYRVEARVTDSSRREIVGNGTVRVTRQRYYVDAHAEHCLYRPQDKVRVAFKALDANEQPVQTEGLVKVTREQWDEIWLDPDGREVKGEALRLLQAAPIFPPPTPATGPGWRVKFRGYQHDEIFTRLLKTDTNGIAELSFTPERDGYYRVVWSSEDSSGAPKSGPRPTPVPVRAETTVWVATGKTTELAYRHGGVELIVDKDTFRVGQRAPVMLVTPTAERHVLFTVEGEDLYSAQVVHLDGTVKLIELPVEEPHTPNIFLSAALVSDRQLFVDTKQVVVPPTRSFLTVEVKPDRPQYQPRNQGTFTLTTRDDQGRAVAAEVAFGLVDESVFYIQEDYAGDPRQFYFGHKRPQVVQTQSTMNQKSYGRLVRGENDQLIDELTLNGRQAGAYNLQEESEAGYLVRDKDAQRLSVSTASGRMMGGLGGGLDQPLNAPAGAALNEAVYRQRRDLSDFAKEESKSKLTDNRKTPSQEPAVQVRTDFRSTVWWQPNVLTDQHGRATITVTYPDSLTGWKATARAASQGNQFGIAEAATRTQMPLLVRLQGPRFFVVGDSVTISGVVNNNTDQALAVRVGLEEKGGLKLKNGDEPSPPLSVPAHGEARVDWVAAVQTAGEVKLKVTARSEACADAMEKSFVAYEHGIEKLIAKSGKARNDDFTVRVDLPHERRPGSSRLTVQLTPSLAVTMLDALPYLVDYPYGCTEQTMSRFLPAVITAKTLRELGLHPEDIMGRVFGGIEPANAAATHSGGKKDLAELDRIVRSGWERLSDFQHSDGGWGWWKQGESDHWMTAYVVWGLALAHDAGVPFPEEMLRRGAEYLDKTLVEEETQYDLQAWMLHALSAYHHALKLGTVSPFQEKAFANLWTNREKLNAYTRALLALSAHAFGKTDQAAILVQNLQNGVQRDTRPDASLLLGSTLNSQPSTVLTTAHWGEDGVYWHWSEGGVEATAFALRALLAIDPKNPLVEPVTNWLIKNRRGAQWNSTRDTAIAVLTLNDYLRQSGELQSGCEYELLVNGTSVTKQKVSGADLLKAPSRFVIDPALIQDTNAIQVHVHPLDRNAGAKAPAIYFAVEARCFSQEEPITPAGNELFVRRDYFKLAGRPTLLKGYVYEKEPLRDGERVRSGERVEVVLTVEAKNNYEYLMFEDLKPAGLEAVQVRSGEPLNARELKSGAVEKKFGKPNEIKGQNSPYTDRSRWVYQELRDRKVALFLDKLPQGVWEMRYELRAEVPGQFHALPVVGQAMYVPEIRGNSAEVRVGIEEAPENLTSAR